MFAAQAGEYNLYFVHFETAPARKDLTELIRAMTCSSVAVGYSNDSRAVSFVESAACSPARIKRS